MRCDGRLCYAWCKIGSDAITRMEKVLSRLGIIHFTPTTTGVFTGKNRHISTGACRQLMRAMNDDPR